MMRCLNKSRYEYRIVLTACGIDLFALIFNVQHWISTSISAGTVMLDVIICARLPPFTKNRAGTRTHLVLYTVLKYQNSCVLTGVCT